MLKSRFCAPATPATSCSPPMRVSTWAAARSDRRWFEVTLPSSTTRCASSPLLTTRLPGRVQGRRPVRRSRTRPGSPVASLSMGPSGSGGMPRGRSSAPHVAFGDRGLRRRHGLISGGVGDRARARPDPAHGAARGRRGTVDQSTIAAAHRGRDDAGPLRGCRPEGHLDALVAERRGDQSPCVRGRGRRRRHADSSLVTTLTQRMVTTASPESVYDHGDVTAEVGAVDGIPEAAQE